MRTLARGACILMFFLVAVMPADNSHPVLAQTTPQSGAGSYLPLAFGQPCDESPTLRPSTVFGVQMYGNTSKRSRYFTPLIESGASWVRAEVYWANIEPQNVAPVDFRWTQTDSILAASSQAGINMIATIGFAPRWAGPHANGPIDADKLADFGEFLTALVERYDGDGIDDAPCDRVVKYWEFFNEPDGGPKPDDVRWGEYGTEYAEMLRVAYAAVKAADPEAQVLLGGIAYDWFSDQDPPGPFVRSFLTDVLDAGGGDHFDVMNFHVYPAFAPNWTSKGPGLYEKAQSVRQALADYGLDKPIVITEAGNHSNLEAEGATSDSSQQQQAGYVVKLFTQAMAADIDTLIWFMLYDPPEDYPNKNGLVTTADPPQPKLAFFTFQRTVAELADASFADEMNGDELADELLHIYRFIESGQDIYVVWLNPTGASGQVAQSLPGEQAQVLDIYGNTTLVDDGADGNDDGQIEIGIGGDPLLIRITDP